jgi:uncharacterized protein YjbJ (UPF0337 family)
MISFWLCRSSLVARCSSQTLNYFNYFSEIEELFVRRRGRNLLLSPLDWALIESWQERAVPLHIILRSIEKIFDGVDQQPERRRSVKSLLYCKEEIEAQYAEWLERQVGKNGAGKTQNSKIENQSFDAENLPSSKTELFPDDAIAAHLEKISLELKSAKDKAKGDLQTALETVWNRLADLKRKSHAAENLEDSLEKLDALVDESLLRNYETEKLKGEIEKQIASYKNKMEAEVYQRTFDLMLLKRLREQAEIPRLSLFYL